MSVKELRLVNEDIVMTIRRTNTPEEMWNITMHEPIWNAAIEAAAKCCWIDMILDRNSAHMLYLYLKDHLDL